jgi:hypothetical protein
MPLTLRLIWCYTWCSCTLQDVKGSCAPKLLNCLDPRSGDSSFAYVNPPESLILDVAVADPLTSPEYLQLLESTTISANNTPCSRKRTKFLQLPDVTNSSNPLCPRVLDITRSWLVGASVQEKRPAREFLNPLACGVATDRSHPHRPTRGAPSSRLCASA